MNYFSIGYCFFIKYMILSIRNNLFKEDIIMLKKNGVIVLQGDSITDAGRFGDEEHLGSGYPRMVAKYIENSYPDYSIKVYNKGISGNRSKDLVARWKEDTLDLNPTVVTILIGINDTWRAFDSNDPTSAEEYAANCEKIMKWTKEAGAALTDPDDHNVPRLVIRSGSVTVKAKMNDSFAARDFMNRLPMTVTGFNSGVDYCCELTDGIIDETELQDGWKNGDINLSGGWFAILYGGEEESASYHQMIIAHLTEEDNRLIQTLPGQASFRLSLEEPYRR